MEENKEKIKQLCMDAVGNFIESIISKNNIKIPNAINNCKDSVIMPKLVDMEDSFVEIIQEMCQEEYFYVYPIREGCISTKADTLGLIVYDSRCYPNEDSENFIKEKIKENYPNLNIVKKRKFKLRTI